MQGDYVLRCQNNISQAACVYAHKWHRQPKAIGGECTEIPQRQCGKERIYVDIEKIADKESTSRRGGAKTRVIVERVYNGTQDMEEVFRSINEQNAIRNIRAMMDNNTASDGTESA